MLLNLISYSVHTVIESMDKIFDEGCFSSKIALSSQGRVPTRCTIFDEADETYLLRDSISNDFALESGIRKGYVGSSKKKNLSEARKGTRVRKEKPSDNDYQTYLVEGTRDEISS